MPHRIAVRYCHCGTRLAADNPSNQCLNCVRQEQVHLQQPPDLPLEYWLTDRFDDAFAAQHIGLVSVAYRQSPYHRIPITQEQLGSWFGMSQPEVSRIESGPPIRHLDRLAHWARTLKIPPQLLWFDLPGRRRTTLTSSDRTSAHPEPAASPAPSAPGSSEPPPGNERRDDADHDHGLVVPVDLAALLEAGGESSASSLLELLAEASGFAPVTGLAPAGLVPPIGPASSSPSVSGLLAALSTGRNLAFEAGHFQIIARFGEVLLVAVDRRLFLIRAGLTPGLAIPLVHAEGTRHGLARTMLGDSRGGIEEWRIIVREHWAPFSGTPMERFTRLQSDLSALCDVFEHERSESGQNELRQAGAMLTALMSPVAADLGDLSACRRWARTSRQLADASGDLHTRLWVRGKEVGLGLYQQRPVIELLSIAEEGIALGEAGGPQRTSAWPLLMSGAAQTLAMTGRRAEAETALDQTRDGFAAAEDSSPDGSFLSFRESNLLFTESFVYAYLDEYGKAEAAQDRALRLYSRPAQIELMRALCQVRMGDTTVGVAHARETIGRLPQGQRVHTVIDLGRKVIEAVPVEERRTEEAVALGQLVGSGV